MRKWLAHTTADYDGNDKPCEYEFELGLTPLEVAQEFAAWPAHEQAQCLLAIARDFEERGKANAHAAVDAIVAVIARVEGYEAARDLIAGLADKVSRRVS